MQAINTQAGISGGVVCVLVCLCVGVRTYRTYIRILYLTCYRIHTCNVPAVS
jgi:hypothetical protein